MRFLILLMGSVLLINSTSAQQIGRWSSSSNGLPVYQYQGALPFKAVDKDGKDAVQPEDPYFLIGNYRLTLFTHASGIYQLITAERAWARLNAAERPNYGWNEASVVSVKDSKTVRLTGVNSIAADPGKVQKHFGIGFARYCYKLDNSISCTRIISVKPSEKINTGNPSFVVTVVLKNNGSIPQELVYSERTVANFVLNSTQYTKKNERPLLHNVSCKTDAPKETAIAGFDTHANKFLVLPKKDERFVYDIAPPSLFMYSKGSANDYKTEITTNTDTLAARIRLSLKPGESKLFNVVIGIADGQTFDLVQQQADDLLAGADLKHPLDGLFAAQWKNRLPDFSSEKNMILRREMAWNAHMIEASAKYSDYYKETFIPQGSVYSYFYGDNISNRDHLQAALPACYTNPEMAKSIMKYVIKHSENDGEIKRGNYSGYGYTPPSLYKESDPQLYFFNTIAEYLLITKDFGFLNESVEYFPAENGKKDPVITMLKKYFVYLRDEVGTGPSGLVKILNSDWSDSFFYNEYSPNKYAAYAESHLNSAMVLVVFPKLLDVLKQSKNREAISLIDAMEVYRAKMETAFMKDLGTNKFAARAYLGRKIQFGRDNVCIEPQGYLLQIPNLPQERKKEMYEYIKSKIINPEKIGARTRERPLWNGKPEGEDGGIWFALEYPLLLGVATFDKQEAKALLMKFSFDNYAKNYPNYWVGHWTAADEVNSTLYREGLYAFWVGVPNLKEAFQGYCSHPHTWPLFCYYKLYKS